MSGDDVPLTLSLSKGHPKLAYCPLPRYWFVIVSVPPRVEKTHAP